MAIYFVKTATIVAAPDNANDGRDPLGIALVNATYDHTGNGEGDPVDAAYEFMIYLAVNGAEVVGTRAYGGSE